jgi:predicted nucleic acid-binding protein
VDICLDTSAYSAFKRGDANIVEAIATADSITLPAIVLGELLAGFRAGSREQANREELGRFLASPRVSRAPIDDETAERYAEIVLHLRRAGTPVPTNDIWIAAVAMERGLVLHTTDPHFERVPQVIVRRHQL